MANKLWFKYGLCLLAAFMAAVTGSGMTAEHHCRHCAEAEAQAHCHDHALCGHCDHCDHCKDCWYYHADAADADFTPQVVLPSVQEIHILCVAAVPAVLPPLFAAQHDAQTQRHAPPVPEKAGRRTLSVIHKLIV